MRKDMYKVLVTVLVMTYVTSSLIKVREQASTALVPLDPQQCIEEKCPTQWAACQKDPKCGPALQDCYKKCGTKESCWTLCLPSKGSQAAIDVAKCAQANNCLSISTAEQICMTKSCSDEIYSCLSDQTCSFFVDHCASSCNFNASCQFDCYVEKRVFSPLLHKYFTCAGESKCI